MFYFKYILKDKVFEPVWKQSSFLIRTGGKMTAFQLEVLNELRNNQNKKMCDPMFAQKFAYVCMLLIEVLLD